MECAECVEPLSLPCYLTCLSYETSTLRMTMLHCEPNIEEPLAHFRIQLSQVSKISKQKLKSTTKVSIVLSSLSLSWLFLLVMKTSNDVPWIFCNPSELCTLHAQLRWKLPLVDMTWWHPFWQWKVVFKWLYFQAGTGSHSQTSSLPFGQLGETLRMPRDVSILGMQTVLLALQTCSNCLLAFPLTFL